MVNQRRRQNEGEIQSDLFSERSLEWFMLIDILVILSCLHKKKKDNLLS